MADPIDEIFNGTPDGIDEEELNQMNAENQQGIAELQTYEKSLEEECQVAQITRNMVHSIMSVNLMRVGTSMKETDAPKMRGRKRDKK